MDYIKNFGKLELSWINSAIKLNKTIVLPEANKSERVFNAGLYCAKNNIANIVFLSTSEKDFKNCGLEKAKNIKVVNIHKSELLPVLANALFIKRQEKGLTLAKAYELLKNPIYFATMMVELGLVDGSVSGAECASKDTFKPAFEIIKGKQGEKVSSFFIMIANDDKKKAFLLSDCAINLNPDANLLALIAKQSASSFIKFVKQEPRVALLSYSTKGSGEGEQVDKVAKSISILNKEILDFCYDGELQLDCAVVPEVANLKNPNGKIKGDANVLIFPDLQSGNIGYKIMQRFGNFKAIGPIMQGLNKPINDISRGANVEEIVLTIAITCLQN